MRLLSPAKINLHLRVGPPAADGFHPLLSWFCTIGLFDNLTFERAREGSVLLRCDSADVPAGQDNLVLRAVSALGDALSAGREGTVVGASGIVLSLQKRIPVGAGLGGGSSDAARTLLSLNRLWEAKMPSNTLARIAGDLGSDVPFFLTGGEANVTGRGELVTPVEDIAPARLLLLVPPFSISTAAVYREHAGRFALPERLEIESSDHRNLLGPNDLASAVLRVEPRMGAYLESAARITPDHLISGSGATIVLHAASEEAAAELERRHPEARLYSCRTLTRTEYEGATRPTSSPQGGLP